MKQHILQKLRARKRPWQTATRPWNALALADAIEKKKSVETTVKIESIEVPLQFINAMERKGYISRVHDEQDISEFMLLAAQEKLYGRVRAARY